MVLINPKHETFAQAMASGVPQTKAAGLAGFKALSAPSQGSRMVRLPEIMERIRELRAEKDGERAKALAQVEMPTRIAVLADLVATREMAKEQGNLGARLKANELLGRELGMFVQRVDATVSSPLDGLSAALLSRVFAEIDRSDVDWVAEPKVIDAEPVEDDPLG